jgi:hypothetical protein
MNELKILFTQMSNTNSTPENPENLVRTITDWEGNPFNSRVQQDACEFFADFP